MNHCLSFRQIALACTLIVAASAGTARSQFYDPLNVQNKYHPFGEYGPTFQYTSPTKVLNVLNGGTNPPGNSPVARRVVSSRVARLDELHLLVNIPSGPWVVADPTEGGSSARYMLSRRDPKIMLSLAGEPAAPDASQSNSGLLIESQAKMRSLGGNIEPGEQHLAAGGIKGIAYSATIANGDFTTYYQLWVATHNDFNYKLAVYGDKHDKSMIDDAMRTFVRGMRPLQPTNVARREGSSKTVTR